jgi:hypothetical protein
MAINTASITTITAQNFEKIPEKMLLDVAAALLAGIL